MLRTVNVIDNLISCALCLFVCWPVYQFGIDVLSKTCVRTLLFLAALLRFFTKPRGTQHCIPVAREICCFRLPFAVIRRGKSSNILDQNHYTNCICRIYYLYTVISLYYYTI